MRLSDLVFGFRHLPAIVQIAVTSVKLRLTLNEIDYFCALCNKGLLQFLNACYAYKKCWYLIKNKLSHFLCFLTLVYVFITGIS